MTAAATTATAAIAAALPSYEIGPELGRGGFGIVYSGVQRHLGRHVAIKQLPPAFANDREIRDRFVTEARVLASLEHPHIVPIYDYVEQDGLCLLVMEALTGGSVWDVFRKDGLNPAHACVLVIAAAAGLHHAHLNGVLHRDVKPENLLLTANNHLKVADFGIAKVIGGGDAVATNDGGILGTPAYMAPEQADGTALGPPADVYATGVMLYELLSGTLPFSQDGGGLAIVYRHLNETPTPLTDIAPSVPQPIAEVVMQAIARQAVDRFATAEEFAVALGESAVEGFGDFWYRESGLRVISSDPVMSTLTSGQLRRRSTGGRVIDGPVLEPGVDPRPTVSEPWLNQPPADGEPTQAQPGARPNPIPTPPRNDQLRPAPAADQPTVDPNLPVLHPVPIRAADLPDVRASIAAHVVGAISIDGRIDAKPEPLVPVRQLLDVPPVPQKLAAATGLVLLLLLVVALLGLGAPTDHSGTTGGTLTLGGTNVVTNDEVSLDLGSAIPVTVAPVPADASTVTLTLAVDGVQVGKSDPARLTRRGDSAMAALKLGSVRYLVAGPADGTVSFRNPAGDEVGSRHVQVTRSSTGFATISGIVVVLLMLFVLAYLESLVRPLWRLGRFRVQAGVGLGLIGALLGVVLTLLAWVLGLYEANVVTAVLCAVLGAAFGVLLGLTAAGWGLHARVRRINKRAPAAVLTHR